LSRASMLAAEAGAGRASAAAHIRPDRALAINQPYAGRPPPVERLSR
jgi:hypothetical protein